jgi:hypothetical protein
MKFGAGFFIWIVRVSTRITWLLLAELPGHALMVIHRNAQQSRGRGVLLLPPLAYRIAGLIGTTAALWILAAVIALISGAR